MPVDVGELPAIPSLPKRTGTVAPRTLPRQIPRVLLVGASTGGPALLQKLLVGLPTPFPLPIVIVQHISNGFAAGLAKWLHQTTEHQVELVGGRSTMKPGTVYVAPDDQDLAVASGLKLEPRKARAALSPCIDVTFQTAAAALGGRCVALLLTGMGRDGSQGMRALWKVGAVTIAQDPATCAVGSMPRSAIELGAVESIVPAANLSQSVTTLVQDLLEGPKR